MRQATAGRAKKIALEQLVQAMEEPATQDIRGASSSSRSCCARSARSPTPKLAEAAMRPLRGVAQARRAPARPRQGRRLRRRRGGHADGRVVAAARRRPSSTPRSATTRSPPLRHGRPTTPSSGRGGDPERARLLRRLVRLRPQGPARPLHTARRSRASSRASTAAAARRPSAARRCGRRCARRSPSPRPTLYGHGDCAARPRRRVLRQEPLDGRRRPSRSRRSRSRTARRSSRRSRSRNTCRAELGRLELRDRDSNPKFLLQRQACCQLHHPGRARPV